MAGGQLSGQTAREHLYEILRSERPFEEKAREALQVGKQYLSVDNGHLTRIDTATDHWEAVISTDGLEGQLSAGTEHDLGQTYCRKTVRTASPVALHDAKAQGWGDDPAFEEHGLSCYHGTTLVVDEELYGTVCFVSEQPRQQAFDDGETLFAELLTRLLERELERNHHEAELTRRANLVNVLNRVLRHNVRNDMSVIRGRVRLMADRLEDSPNAEIATRKIDELTELTQKARDLEQIVGREFDRETVDARALVERVVERTATAFPEATVAVDGAETVTVDLLESFERAIEELIENAAEHAGDAPSVAVTVEQTSTAVEIRVVDDGPGLPETEQRVLRTGEESPLIHGSGIGLWIVHWIVSSHDGSVEATVTDDGTTLTVQIPRHSGVEQNSPVTEIRRARDRYQALFEEASDALVLIDDDAVIIEANGKAADIYGPEPQELRGRSLSEFVPASIDFQSVWADFRQRGEEHDRTTVIGADGVRRTVEYSATTDILPGQHLLIVRNIAKQSSKAR